MKAPGKPTNTMFFPAQYSAMLIFSTSGNPCITSTEGIFAGAANAKERAANGAAAALEAAAARTARDSFMIYVTETIFLMMIDCGA